MKKRKKRGKKIRRVSHNVPKIKITSDKKGDAIGNCQNAPHEQREELLRRAIDGGDRKMQVQLYKSCFPHRTGMAS